MEPLLIYSPRKTNRLVFVLDWLFTEQLKTGYRLIHDLREADEDSIGISYGHVHEQWLSVPDAELLWENTVRKHAVGIERWNGLPTLYALEQPGYTLPFDLFSAVFFLLSRYEEYYSYTPDKHNRYPATESILYKNNLLKQLVADEWVQALRKLLKEHFNVTTGEANFRYQPTYDIDIAWSYRHKGVLRASGAAAKNIIRGNFSQLKERVRVLSGKQTDPYDSYAFLEQLHSHRQLQPIYFILATAKATAFDKNIPLSHASMQQLIQRLGKHGTIGIHPSYYTDKTPAVLEQEKSALENITGRITQSRQHYIKLRLPDTYRMLIDCGIKEDHSMGYGTHTGFRAGTGQSFLWFDLEHDTITSLRIYPFCFMDTTAHYDMGLSAVEAFKELYRLFAIAKQCNSTLTTVFHNFSLGTDKEWNGWRELYAAFIAGVIS